MIEERGDTMPEVAYKDVYEQEEMMYRVPMLRSEVNILSRDVDTLKNDVAEMKRDISSLKSDVTELKHDVRILQTDVAELKSDVKDLRVEVSSIKVEFRARMDGMDKRIDDIHASQNKWFTLMGLLIAIVPIAIAIVQSLMSK